MSPKSPSKRALLLIGACVVFCYAFYRVYRFARRLHLPTTEAVLMALGAAGGCWEMFTLANKKHGDSFSAVIRKLGHDQTFIPFVFGQLGEHLFAGDPVTLEALRAGQAAGRFWPLLDKEDATPLPATGLKNP